MKEGIESEGEARRQKIQLLKNRSRLLKLEKTENDQSIYLFKKIFIISQVTMN
jgi:hypothetical protein